MTLSSKIETYRNRIKLLKTNHVEKSSVSYNAISDLQQDLSKPSAYESGDTKTPYDTKKTKYLGFISILVGTMCSNLFWFLGLFVVFPAIFFILFGFYLLQKATPLMEKYKKLFYGFLILFHIYLSHVVFAMFIIQLYVKLAI